MSGLAKYPKGVTFSSGKGTTTARSGPRLVVACQHPGCRTTTEFFKVGEAISPDGLSRRALCRGWSKHNDGYRCPEHSKGKRMATKADEPALRAPTKEQRRLILREIDENYSAKSYVPGTTDKSIGEKLNVPWAWVRDLREENFGPAGLDPEIQGAINRIEELQARLSKLEADSLAAFEKTMKEAEDITAQIAAVRAAMVRFAA